MPGKFQPERNLFQKRMRNWSREWGGGEGGRRQGEDAPYNYLSPHAL